VLRKHADAPNANIPADWNEKVLHAQLELDNATLMGADIPNAHRAQMHAYSEALQVIFPGRQVSASLL